MDDPLIVVALLLVAASATAAVAVRDPARQALVLAVLGTVLAVLFTVLQAPDVALSQLAVGSALTPLLIMLSVRKVRRPKKRRKEAER
ncbi:Na(+)/H(+) antiporter subunit B [Streptomyces prunicolor]|uniref:Na(+)/H(+) antiporter subunit B n=1 Tax=Streptomyces prunicolor TaxID=67348 RepID=UPI00371C5CFB